MARIPKKCCDTSFFHVIVQGLNKEYIYSKEKYIKQYLRLLNKNIEDSNVKILAYCIMNNHAHILLYIERIEDMSKLMQKVNTKYAKYYNYMNKGRVGYVFRDRYISEEIKNESYLIKCINYIHNNPVKANIVEKCEDYKYSSYREYINGKRLDILEKILNIKLNEDLFINIDCNYVFEDIDLSTNERIERYIKDFINVSNICKEEVMKDRILLKLLVKYLKKSCKVKYTDMMKYFKISKGQMENLKI